MRITLEEIIERHKKSNPNTDYDYGKTVLGQTLHDKVIITCPIHGDFIQAPHEHMKGQGCPKCAIERNKQMRITEIDSLIEQSKIKFKNKFSYEKTRNTYKNVKSKCTFHCNECDIDFEVSFHYHLRTKDGCCPKCREKIKNFYKEKRKLKQKEIQEKKDRIKVRREAEIKVKEERIKQLQIERKQREIEKQRIKEEKRIKREERNSPENLYRYFINRARELGINKKYDLSYITNYENAQTKIPVYCHKKDEFGREHGIFMVKPTSLLQGSGCPKCSNKHTFSGEELLMKFRMMYGDNYDYGNLDDKKSKDKIDIFCKKCNKWFKQVLATHLNNHGCPYCQRSRFEVLIENSLNSRNIEHEYQKRFEWLGLQSIDFYISSLNIGIECQGSQHFIPSPKFGGEEQLKINIERDKRKKQLCKENNLQLIYYLNKKYNSYMEEDDIYFNKKEDILKYIQSKLDNIIEK